MLRETWESYVTRQIESEDLRLQLLSANLSELTPILRNAINDLRARLHALLIIKSLPEEGKRHLFHDVLPYAIYQNANVHLAREIVLSMSATWLRDHLAEEAQCILDAGDVQDLWGVLDLCKSVDRIMALDLARTVSKNPKAEIREVGQHYLAQLENRGTGGT